MLKRLTKLSSLTLGVVMTIATMTIGFTGCGKKDSDETLEEVQASSLIYSSAGVYSVTLQKGEKDYGGVSADDVEVLYSVPSDEAEDGYLTKEADVLGTSVGSDGALSVTFEDPDASTNMTDTYAVSVEKLHVGAVIDVEFGVYTVRCDTDHVYSTDKEVKLTLTLDEGEYADVTKDDISLAGSFENMQVTSVSASGKNLTMQLAGDIVMHESSGAYLDGVVRLSADAVKDNISQIEDVTIPVEGRAAYFDAGRMRWANGAVNAPLVLMDVTDTDTVTANDVVFAGDSGVTVKNVVPVSDDEVFVTLDVQGATDRNSAAAVLNGAEVTVGDTALTADFGSAAFYPVFDFVEQAGENLRITVVLYAKNGTFADGLAASQVSFGGAFEGGTVSSLKRTGDRTAELSFEVPANGQSIDTMDMDGEIVLAQGALINAWGDVKDGETSYLRNYSPESLGRGTNAQQVVGTIQEIAEFTGEFIDLINGEKSVCEAISWICGCFGNFASDDDYAMKFQKEINRKLDSILDLVQANNELLAVAVKEIYSNKLQNFDVAVNKLENACNTLDSYLADACTSTKLSANDLKSRSDPDAVKIAGDLVNAMNKKKNYVDTIKTLKSDFNTVVANLKLSGTDNPFAVFDKLCTMTYNFDTQSKDSRTNYRSRTEYIMERALCHLLMYYVYGDNDLTARETYYTAFRELDKAKTRCPVDQGKAGAAYCYAINRYFVLDTSRAVRDWPYKGWDWGDELLACAGKKSDFDFTATQRDEYVRRMQGRTLSQDFNLAGFGTQYNTGMAFWVERKKGKSDWVDDFASAFSSSYKKHLKEYWAYYIPWNSGKMEHKKFLGNINEDFKLYFYLGQWVEA